MATGGGGGTATVDNNAIANAVWAKTEGDMMNGTVGYEVFNSASAGGSTASEIADAVWNKKESDMASNSIGSLIFKIHKKIIALLGR